MRRMVLVTAGLVVLTACGPGGAGEIGEPGADTTSGATGGAQAPETSPDGDTDTDSDTGNGAGSQTDADAGGGAPVGLDQIPGDEPEEVPSALDDMTDSAFPDPLVDPSQIVSGGPPPDGIPAIDEPKFQRASDIDWLDDGEPVLSVTINGETRGYPVQVMMWHEIVNDTIAGIPVVATYCPLCNSGVTFDRRVGDRVLDFGTSGRLFASNLVMYDRQTESLWPQLTGTASVGVLTGEKLDSHPMIPVAWQDFREAHPDAWVLSRDTGHSRDYGANPYVGYDQPDTGLLFHTDPDDDRLALKARIIALTGDDETVAVERDAVAEQGVLEFTLDGAGLVAWHVPGQVSALEDGRVAGGSDIGSVAVYVPTAGGEELTFAAADGTFTDAETESTWNILGEAVDGPLAGETLEAVPFIDTFWFTWATFQPDTRVVS